MSEERLHKGALDDRNILQALAVFRAELGEPTHVNQFPYIAATFILARLFGPNWIQSEVNGQSQSSQYFYPLDNELLHQMRIIRLAELAWNFSPYSDIDSRMLRITSGEAESVFSELEIAEIFYKAGKLHRFVPDCDTKGLNYDLELAYGRTLVACEIKAKDEVALVGKNTIRNSLKSSLDQMPDNMPCVAVVKIPESWIREGKLRESYQGAFAEVFRNNSKLSAAILRYECVIQEPDGPLTVFGYYIQHNQKANLSLMVYGDLVKQLPIEPPWKSIAKVVSVQHGLMTKI